MFQSLLPPRVLDTNKKHTEFIRPLLPPRLRSLAIVLAGFVSHPSPLENRLRAVGRFTFRQGWKRIVRRPMEVRWQDIRLKVYSDSTSAASAYYLDLPDYWEMLFLSRFLRPGDCVVDVGANVGVYTLLMAKTVGHHGRVVAFEPDKTNMERLRENLSLNSFLHVRVEPQAVGDVCGVQRFLVGRDSEGRLVRETDKEDESREVLVTTLDESLAVEPPPVFCKVDVEGFELSVVRGARSLMARGFPLVWQLEVQSDYGGLNAQGSELAALLREHGYELFWFDPKHNRLCPASLPTQENNLLAVSDRDAVETRLLSHRNSCDRF